jgi:hypothetical protein
MGVRLPSAGTGLPGYSADEYRVGEQIGSVFGEPPESNDLP